MAGRPGAEPPLCKPTAGPEPSLNELVGLDEAPAAVRGKGWSPAMFSLAWASAV